MRSILPLLLVLAGCGKPEPAPETPAPDVCPASSVNDNEAGDANGDGRKDIADGVYALRWLLDGGPAPACDTALDVLTDGTVDVSDALGIWYHLYLGNTQIPGRIGDDCTEATVPSGTCAPLSLGITADGTTAHVTLMSPTLAVQAWSFSVEATGCTIASFSTDGTAAADARLDPAGLRDRGWEHSEVVDRGAVSATALSWRYDRALTPSADPVVLLNLEVTKGSGCECALAFAEYGLSGSGERVQNVVSVGGLSYTPTMTGTSVSLCD